MTALELLISVAGGPAAGQAIEGVKNKLKELGGAADSFKLKLGGMDSMIGQAFGIGTIVAFGAALNGAIKAVEKYDNAMKGLASVARFTGQDLDKTTQAAASLAEDGLMSVGEAATGLKNLLQRGFSLKESIDLMNRFKDSAAFGRQSSLEFGQAIVGATEGLRNENPVLMDNAGVTKNAAKMWEEYAKQIGVGEKSLTLSQKRTAEYNGIIKETEAQLGNAKMAAEGLTGAKARMTAETTKLAVALGTALTPAFLFIGEIVQAGIKGFQFYGFAVESVGAQVGAFALKVKAVFSAFADGPKALKELPKAFAEINKDLEKNIDEIADRWSGKAKTPDIGKDNQRRKGPEQQIKDVDKAAEAAAKKVAALIERLKELTAAQDSPILKVEAEAEKMRKEAKGNAQALVLVEKWRTQEIAKIQGKYMDEMADDMQKGLDEEIKAKKAALEEELKIIEALYEAEVKSADARATLADNLTEINATEYQKRLQAVDRFETEQLKLAFESFTAILKETGDVAKAWKKYEALKTEITAAASQKRQKINKEENGSIADGAAEGFKEYIKSLGNNFDKGKQLAGEFARKIEDTLVEMFDNPKKALKSLGDYFMTTLKRMVAQAMMNPIIVGISGAFSGGGGASGTTAGIAGTANNSLMTSALAPVTSMVTGAFTAAGEAVASFAASFAATADASVAIYSTLSSVLPVLLPLLVVGGVLMASGAFKGDDNLDLNINNKWGKYKGAGTHDTGSGWVQHNVENARGGNISMTTDNMGNASWAMDSALAFQQAGEVVRTTFINLGLDASGFDKEFGRSKKWKEGEATPEAMQAQLTQWFGEWMTQATNIDFSQFAKNGEQLGATVTRIVNSLAMMGSVKDFDVAKIFSEIPTKAKTMQESLRAMDTEIGKAITGLDGLTGQEFGTQLETIGTMIQQRYQAEIQYLTTIKGLQESLHLAIADQIQKYAENSMTLTQKLYMYHDRIITDWDKLQATNDPETIATIQGSIAASVDAQYDILGQLKDLTAGVQQLIGSTLESFDLEMMTREQQLAFFNTRVDSLQTQYNDPNATPEQKAELGNQIVAAARAAWGLMSEEEKRVSLPLIHEVLDPISADMTAFSGTFEKAQDNLTPALQALDVTIQGKLLDAINLEIAAINSLRDAVAAANLSPLGIGAISTGNASALLPGGTTIITPPPINITVAGDLAALLTLTSDYTINMIRRNPNLVTA